MEERVKLEYQLEGFDNISISDNREQQIQHDFVESFIVDGALGYLSLALHKDVNYYEHKLVIDKKSKEIFLGLLLSLKNSDEKVKISPTPKITFPPVEEEKNGKKYIYIKIDSKTEMVTKPMPIAISKTASDVYKSIEMCSVNFNNQSLKYHKL